MHWLEFLAIIGATGALVNAWLHSGGLFDEVRIGIRWWQEEHPAGRCRIRALFARLLLCRVCLSYHVAFWLTVIFFLPGLWLAAPWNTVLFLPVYALAATRFSLLLSLVSTVADVEHNPELDEENDDV